MGKYCSIQYKQVGLSVAFEPPVFSIYFNESQRALKQLALVFPSLLGIGYHEVIPLSY